MIILLQGLSVCINYWWTLPMHYAYLTMVE